MNSKINSDLKATDYATLQEQKRSLMECADRFPILHGLIFLIDEIQGDAIACGHSEKEVFGRDNNGNIS